MGAFQGGLTFKRYYVREAVPDDWRDRFQKGVDDNAFTPIEPAGEDERSIGWCDPRFVLDTELVLGDHRHNNYIALAVRVDTLTVPGPLVKIHTESETRAVMKTQNKEFLSRYEKAEIKDRVKRDLRKKVLPAIKSFDMVWNIDTGEVLFWSTNEKLNIEFGELFEATFGVLPIPDTPYTAAAHGGLGFEEADLDRLIDLQPASFVDVPTYDPEAGA